MQATVFYGACDVRFEDRPEPTIIDPSDAIISLPATLDTGVRGGPAPEKITLEHYGHPIPRYNRQPPR